MIFPTNNTNIWRYDPPTHPRPCSCGRCPYCGGVVTPRPEDVPVWPWRPYPYYPQPVWQVDMTSTNTPSYQ